MLNTSERQLTLTELLELGSVESAIEHILEKEIEAVLRKSHAEQFTWLENRYKLPLRKDLTAWPTFVELTERRNLFVHTGGAGSSQYLAVCREHRVQLDELKVGAQLAATNEYFDTAYRVVYEIGVKLAHVLWRKLRSDQMEDSERALSNLAFDLIHAEKYSLARVLLEFSCFTLKKHVRERARLVDVVNLAQTYKWLGSAERCSALLQSEDWSAAGRDFAICVAVLGDDHARAADLMRQIGPSGEVSEHSYKEWPMFREFRGSAAFNEAYSDVFGHPYVVLEEAVSSANTVTQEQRENSESAV